MSGIIAHTGPKAAAPVLIEGLRRLAQRGHDSLGIALLSRRRLRLWRAVGSPAALERRLPARPVGTCGIAHTRLATHGAPEERNAHPHASGDGRLALVHNGIVENAEALRRGLGASVRWASETDSEVLVQLLAARMQRHHESVADALPALLRSVQGTCGLAVLDRDAPGQVVIARIGSPMVLGRGAAGTFAASDPGVLRGWVDELVHLEDGEIAVLSPAGFELLTLQTPPVSRRPIAPSDETGDETSGEIGPGSRVRGEILEQPRAVERALAGRLDRRFSSARLGGLNLAPEALREVRRVHLLGCGSAWHAALSGARMIESLARLPAMAEPAGEFLFRDPLIEPGTLYIVASRSGETFDTLAALREVRARGGTVLGVVNDVGSTIAREVHGGVYLHAGIERSVVATKTVSAMLTVFALLALALGRLRDVSPQRGARLLDALDALPGHLDEALAAEADIARVAATFRDAASVLFVGRAAGHAIALEGARKLSEASGLHTTACQAAELAHGPIALLGAATPCVVLLPEPDMLPLSLSSLERTKARGAPLVVIGDSDEPRVEALADHFLRVPRTEPLLQPIVAGAALQLLAWHAGAALGRDMDRPGSLAGRVMPD